jgi:hypothetical protein
LAKIEIAGKEYVGKRVTLTTLLKAGKVEEKIQEALKSGEYEKYAILYVSRAELFCAGEDMKQLSPDVLSPQEAQSLESFFLILVEGGVKKSEPMSETSPVT